MAAAIASAAIGGYIRLVEKTTRWTMEGREHFDTIERHLQDKQRQGGFILAFWHARLLMTPILRKETDRLVHMLVSTHRDGEIITRAVKGYDVAFIRGSAANPKKAFKDKSGASAVAQMAAALEEGGVVGVTPDGPRGPREKAQAGVIRLASLTGAPILPVSYATRRGRQLSTWDGFWLPFPFSRGAFVAGPPLFVPPALDNEALVHAKRDLENALASAGDRANAIAGRKTTRGVENSAEMR